ncbi:MAG: ABC transporter permease [Anaerolineae bacterium]
MTETLSSVERVAEQIGPKPASWLDNFWRGVSSWWPEAAAILVGIGVWELVGRLLNFPFFPSFSAVVEAWWEIYQAGDLISQLLVSLRSLAIGYSAAVVLGLALGALMGLFRKVEYFFDPFIDINLSTPTLVYIPIFFALFGVSDTTRYVVVFTHTFFIIVVNTITGIRTADHALMEMGRSFGASDGQLFRKIILPDALPLIMAGLRIGMSRAVKGMINGELFIALVGLGAKLRYYGGAFAIDKVLAILMTLIVVAIVVTAIVQIIDRRLTGWAETVQEA